MLKHLRNPATLAALVLVALLTTGVSARADIILTATQLGNAPVGPSIVATGSPSAPGGVVYHPSADQVFHDFTIRGLALSQEQTASLSEALSSALSITNTSSMAQTVTIAIQYTGYTFPVTPPGATLVSSVGGTTPVTGAGAPNAILFTSQVGGTPPLTLSPSITGTGVAYSASTTQDILTGLSAPYSVFQTYVITLNPGANLQFAGRTDLKEIPEPSSFTLTLVGLPLLGLLFVRRLRRR
jgi:hypothetical protein